MRVLLGGEGKTELGDFAIEPQHRADPPLPGVVQALFERVVDEPVEVVEAVVWKDIRKYAAGKHRRPDTRNVLGLALRAVEARCDAMVFARDRDRDVERGEHIERGIEEAQTLFGPLLVVGGVAIEAIEAWALALAGQRGSEGHGRPKPVADAAGIDTVEAFVERVRQADLSAVAEDAASLRAWLARAERARARPAPT